MTSSMKIKAVCHGCDYYVTIECTQNRICAPLLQNAQYATQVRKFSAHISEIDERRGEYAPILHSSAVQGNGKRGKISRKGYMV